MFFKKMKKEKCKKEGHVFIEHNGKAIIYKYPSLFEKCHNDEEYNSFFWVRSVACRASLKQRICKRCGYREKPKVVKILNSIQSLALPDNDYQYIKKHGYIWDD